MRVYELNERLINWEKSLLLIAMRHDLEVYFDFNIDDRMLIYNFCFNDYMIIGGVLDLNIDIRKETFDIIEKRVGERFDTIKNRSNVMKKEDEDAGDIENEHDELIEKVYTSRVICAICEKYLDAMKEEYDYIRKYEETKEKLESEGGCMMPWGDHYDLADKLLKYGQNRDRAKFAREIWNQAREICMNIAEEMREED